MIQAFSAPSKNFSKEGPFCIVLGAGVSGLSCAYLLSHNGFQVELWSERLTPDTCSDKAAAIFEPYAVKPYHKILPWAKVSYQQFKRFSLDPYSGVRPVHGVQYFALDTPTPEWVEILEDLQDIHTSDKKIKGLAYTTYVIEMPIYMYWLQQQVIARRVTIKQKTISSLNEITEQADWVINCTGLGARELCQDPLVYPIRGQILKVNAPEVNEFIMNDVNPDIPSYIIPRQDGCILGGTLEPNSWDETPSQQVADEIMARCSQFIPILKERTVLSHIVGLRPGRSVLRLEQDGNIIHNYGHGGAGVTLSWGCAEDVLQIISEPSRT